MWKCISGVSNIVDKKKNENPPKAANDTREYEKTGPRMRLKYDEEKAMTCEWCVENKQTLVTQNVLNSNRFIDCCTSYKTKSISQ